MGEERYCAVCGRRIQPHNYRVYEDGDKKGYICGKHYWQFKIHGCFLDNIALNKKDRNKYFVDGEIAWVITTDDKQNETGRFKIDVDDLERVLEKKWHKTGNRYKYKCKEGKKTRSVDIGCFILGKLERGCEKIVDHINRDPSDNRKCNLRIVTEHKNSINRSPMKNKSTLIPGVFYDKNRKRYDAYICFNYKKACLCFSNVSDAVYARYYAELILFKEYRSTANDDLIQEIIERCENKEEIRRRVEEKIVERIGPIEEAA